MSKRAPPEFRVVMVGGNAASSLRVAPQATLSRPVATAVISVPLVHIRHRILSIQGEPMFLNRGLGIPDASIEDHRTPHA